MQNVNKIDILKYKNTIVTLAKIGLKSFLADYDGHETLPAMPPPPPPTDTAASLVRRVPLSTAPH